MKSRSAKGSRRVALLLDAGRAFDRGLLQGILHYVDLHKPWIVLRPAEFYQRFAGLIEPSLKEIRKLRVDGIIANDVSWAHGLPQIGVPTILVPVVHFPADAPYLRADNRGVAVLAADHLAGQGLRHFAYAGFAGAVWSTERCEHFCRRLAEKGVAVQTHLVPLSPSKAERSRHEAALSKWLTSLPKPVGIMACNDDFARSLIELCRIRSLRVPEQVALIGVDNDELICKLSNPPLSSVGFATEHAGYETAALLDRLMAGRKVPVKEIPVAAGHVVARQSTNMMAIKDEEVVKALRYIRQNSYRLVRVDEVVDATLLSHRTLNNRFYRAVGRSLVKEIGRHRAAHIGRLLLESNEPIARIARTMGYETPGHLSRNFLRETGMTPRAYRQSRQRRTPGEGP
jgi:LacI family transcriptional regulator